MAHNQQFARFNNPCKSVKSVCSVVHDARATDDAGLTDLHGFL